MFNLRTLISNIVFALLLAGRAVSAAPLNFCYEDVAQKPWTMPDNSGLNITLLKQVEKLIGEQFTFSAKPWKRCQEETRQGVVDGFFASAINSERLQYSVFPTRPDGSPDKAAALYEDRFGVYLRKNGKGTWDGKKLDSPQFPVLVQRGYHVANLLRDQGFSVNETIKSADDGLRFLVNNLADVAILQGEQARSLALHDPRFVDAVIASPIPYQVLPLYLAVGRKRYDENPKRIEAIWAAIRQVRESPEYRAQLNAAASH
jgi:polar amino acid transport system substrate-binding protein